MFEDDSNLIGLTDIQVKKAQSKLGFNEVQLKQVGLFGATVKRLWEPTAWLLEVALILELLLGKKTQALVVLLLLLFSAIDGAIQEQRAKKAIGFLDTKLTVTTWVKRDQNWQTRAARDLVVNDLIHLRIGDIVPADATILNGDLDLDESSLTGESGNVHKKNGELIFSGTTVTNGEVIAQVAKIGRDSASGKTTELIKTAEAPGRLQTLLFTIVRYLAYLDVVLAVVLVITALIRGTSWTFLLPFLVILFIATIPVSMPSSFTVANSLEAQNLAKKDILVSGLVGIQEAASMNALLVDKTGTLTRNQSKVIAVKSFNSKFSLNQIMVAALTLTDDTNNSVIDQALKNYGHQNNIESVERKSFRPFSPVTKYSSGEVQFNGQPIKLMLGSPEALTNLTGDTTEAKQIAAMAQSGRLICVASTNQILGAIILADTPRPDSKKAVLAVQKLGVKVIMVTGDDIKTAKSVAGQVGIGPRIGTLADIQNEPDLMLFDGFANIFPADKLKIVKKLQQQGQVVGMTGDGINDAPALKQADVGIAVNSASDVVKLAARVVLTKPGLTDIVPIIDSGHRVYRRMMTWIITKLARTAELAALLTFGFIFTGFFPVSLSLIVFIVVMNDMVTLVLGTDRAWRTQIPERWNLPQLAKIAGIFTIGWLVIGFGLLWFYLQIQKLSSSQISSAMFLYLIYSAMATIWMTRVRDHFWSFAPSKAVGWMTFADIAVATTMVLAGLITAKISISIVLEVLIVTIVGMIILDQIKMVYYHHNGILGTEIQN